MSLMRASSSEPVSPVTLLMALGLTRSGTEVSASWISGAFVHIARLWPLILLAKICMVIMLRLPFFRLGDGVQAGLLALMLLVDGLVMILPRQERFRSLMPHVQNWAMLAMLFLSGLVYSLWLDGKLPAAPGAVLKLAVPELVVALLVACIVGDRRLLGMSYFLGLLLA
ncbi:MAG: diguanylate cyclase, partial [Sphingomonadaceae bacterium MED-G03]